MLILLLAFNTLTIRGYTLDKELYLSGEVVSIKQVLKYSFVTQCNKDSKLRQLDIITNIVDLKDNMDIDIEKEVFVHGALCICYSGQCLMSSLIMNRSGNRGECAGMCRLSYKLLENDKEVQTKGEYLLSTREFCTIENLKEILDANA